MFLDCGQEGKIFWTGFCKLFHQSSFNTRNINTQSFCYYKTTQTEKCDEMLRTFGIVETSMKKPWSLNAIEMMELESRDWKLDMLCQSRF
jgi:hypothetical protein